jgi:hypothetical protein
MIKILLYVGRNEEVEGKLEATKLKTAAAIYRSEQYTKLLIALPMKLLM